MEHSEQERFEMHALVKGHVQGVGFRASTHYHAQLLGLKGTVRNLPDGTVEIYAQGTREYLEELMKRVEEEVGIGAIEEAAIEYFPIETAHKDFRII